MKIKMNTKIGIILGLNQLTRLLSTSAKARATHYEILGISPTATSAEIKAAYYEKTKLYHPDVVEPTEENLQTFRRISEAYEILGNQPLRQAYDENVLGVIKEDASTDDPIEYYKRRVKRDEGGQSWSKNYCDHLRREQSGTYISSKKHERKKKRNTDNFHPGFFAVPALLFLTFLLSNVISNDLKNTPEKAT